MNEDILTVKAVAFDLDGTLLDTVYDLHAAASRMLETLGLPQVPIEEVRRYVGNGVPTTVKRLITRQWDGEPEPALHARALELFEDYYAAQDNVQSRPYPGVLEGLTRMHRMGLRLGVITNKAMRFTPPLLREVGLDGFFELVLGGDSLPRRKPDPAPLYYACGHFGVHPSELLMVGDSPADVHAAKAAGCPVFCVPYGYNQGQDVRTLGADRVVADFVEAAGYLARKTD